MKNCNVFGKIIAAFSFFENEGIAALRFSPQILVSGMVSEWTLIVRNWFDQVDNTTLLINKTEEEIPSLKLSQPLITDMNTQKTNELGVIPSLENCEIKGDLFSYQWEMVTNFFAIKIIIQDETLKSWISMKLSFCMCHLCACLMCVHT